MQIRLRMRIAMTLLLAPAALQAMPGSDGEIPARQSAAKPALQLSLKQAVDIALGPEGNARVRIAEELIRQARARSAQGRVPRPEQAPPPAPGSARARWARLG